MAETQFLALFDSADNAANAIDKLHGIGVPDDQITVMSGFPYRGPVMGRHHFQGKLPLITLLGALMGVALAAFLTVGIFLIWPLRVGGQPIVPIPPSLIIFFELTMLGTMWATFFGMLFLNRFPAMDKLPYDPRITEGNVGVLAFVDDTLGEEVEQALKSFGAFDIKRERRNPKPRSHKFELFWGGAGLTGLVLVGILGLFLFDVIRIPFPTNMIDQDSIAYDQGPRLAAPADSVPIQGPVLIDGAPATQPLPSTPASIARGKELYSLNCLLCHGPQGAGNGPVSGFFTPKPANLTVDVVQKLPDSEIFLVITQGRGAMPSISENLDVADRWDVINFVRTLKK
jgi:mono/diheme cytochrome c family protein